MLSVQAVTKDFASRVNESFAVAPGKVLLQPRNTADAQACGCLPAAEVPALDWNPVFPKGKEECLRLRIRVLLIMLRQLAI